MSQTHERWSPAARDPDDDSPRLECGVFGVFDVAEASGITALGLHALQHRGQEACGIAAFDGQRFHTERHMGRVGEAFGDGLQLGLFVRRGHGIDPRIVQVLPRIAEMVGPEDHHLDGLGLRRLGQGGGREDKGRHGGEDFQHRTAPVCRSREEANPSAGCAPSC